MTRWVRSNWGEGRLTYFFHIEHRDGEEWVVRQVELVEPGGIPAVASSLDEWMAALDAGRVQEYQKQYGPLSDQPVDAWDEGWPSDGITSEEFEDVWRRARRHLETHGGWVDAQPPKP